MRIYTHPGVRKIEQHTSIMSAESIGEADKDFDAIQNLVRCRSMKT